MMALVYKGFVVALLSLLPLLSNAAPDVQLNHLVSLRRPNSSRILVDAVEDSSLTKDVPLVYRNYDEKFVLDLFGITELLPAPDIQLLEATTKVHLNERLRSSQVDISVSSVKVTAQKRVENSIPILSMSLRILGEVVSTDAETIAALSFQDVVLQIFTTNPSELTRSLKKASDAFDTLLVPKASLLEPTYSASDSEDKNLIVMAVASVGAAIFTALVLGACLWRQQVSKNSTAADKALGKDDFKDDLDIASTWSSSDESSDKPPVTPEKLMRSFPSEENRTLSPCIEDGGEDSSAVSSQEEGILSLKNWTYSSSSSSESDSSDAETVQISLSMQSIDDFEASIRSTPPRKRRILLEI